MAATSSGYQVSLPGVESGEDVLGIWQARPLPAARPRPQASAFGVSAKATQIEPIEATIWQIDLPRDPRQAADQMAWQEWRLAQAELALPEAEKRLDHYVEIRGRSGPAGSFGVGRRTGPEANLDAWLGGGAAVSFGGIPGVPDAWEATLGQASAMLKRLGRAAAYAAWVETSVSNRLIGRTTVAWDGDFTHYWRPGASTSQADQHQRNLTFSLRSRLAWIKMTFLVVTGGLKLAALAPTGPIGTIPAALQFFRQIIAQAQEIQAITAQNQ